MNRLYKDLSLTFKPHPNTGDVTRVLDFKSISQAMQTLLRTRIGERPFSSLQKGSRIYDYLFDIFDPTIVSDIREEVTTLIVRYEPRVFVIAVDVFADIDNNRLGITITYAFKTLPSERQNITVFFEQV